MKITEENRDICLLLTATIAVEDKSLVKRSDAATRLQDYKLAIKKWLTKQTSLRRIVFVENSGYPLTELKAIVQEVNPLNKEVEFISFKYVAEGSQPNISLGEIRCIEYALSHSRLLSESQKFVKVTGRVFVENIDKIIGDLCQDFHVVSRLSENLMYMDSVLAIFDTKAYTELINDYVVKEMQNFKEHIDFESVYARAIHYLLEKNYRWYPFAYEPIFSGMSGTKNVSYARVYSRRRSLWVGLISYFYHRVFRNVYSNRQGREHLLKRWNITPKK